jgi:LacI family transcriptional regulator
VVKAAEDSGYLVIILQSNEKYEDEKQHIELLVHKKVDGILISLADNTIDHKHINQIIKSGVPVVLFDKISKLVNCHKIVIDDEKAAFEATEHLIEKGCKKIAHVRGLLKPQTTIDRFKGYQRALKQYNIEYDKKLVFEAP